MKLFGKRRNNSERAASGVSDKIAGKIAGLITSVQSKFAVMMNKTFQKMTPGKLKLFLILFCLMGGGVSTYFIVHSIISPKASTTKMKVDAISVPGHVDQSIDDQLYDQPFVDRDTYDKIQEFKIYMDSLKHDRIGRRIYDSVMSVRPGLLDSAIMLENIFLSQDFK